MARTRTPAHMRKISAFLLALALLAGCMGFGVRAAGPEVTRVVTTFYDKGAQGFHWYTAEDGDSIVTIGSKTYAGTSVKYQDLYAHSVVAEGLAPGTAYTYRIGDYTGNFKTDPGRGAPVDFIVTGDVQASNADNFAYSARTLGAAWDAFPDSDFYVTLGDFTNECDDEQWDLYFDAFKNINSKSALVPIAGNHDGNLKWGWFANMFTLRQQPRSVSLTGVFYSFDYGDAHIAVLNSNDMYPMSMQQRNWLINDMSRSDAKWKLVFVHRACYSAGNDGILPDNLLMRRALIPLFDELGIDLAMNGHDHQYYRSEPVKADKVVGAASQTGTSYTDAKGTVYIMPGAAANKRYAVQEPMLPTVRSNSVIHEDPGKPVYTHISIDGGTLRYAAYTLDPATGESEEYDTLELKKTSFSAPDPNYKDRPTDYVTTFPGHVWNFVSELFSVLIFDYLFALLPGAIAAG